jgi:hypothetical protein
VPLRFTVVVGPVEELLAMSNCPVAAPAVVGSNSILRVAVGLVKFKVSGKVAPEKENPAPEMVTVLTISGAPPEEVKVSDCVVGVLKATSPKAMLSELTVSVATLASRSIVKVLVTDPAVAVKVTGVAVETEDTVAVKLPVVEPAAAVTDEGTVTAALLLARPTENPPVAAAVLRVTVQESVPEPLMDELVQEMAVSTGTPVPLSVTVVDVPVEELLEMANWPEAAPAAVGSNSTVRFAVGFDELRVSGKVAPETEKPDPVSVTELMVTGPVPVEVRVRGRVVELPTEILPKGRVVALTPSVGTVASSAMEYFADALPAVAVSVAVWVVVTAETLAVKLPVAEPAATVTDAGTLTAGSLLIRLTP